MYCITQKSHQDISNSQLIQHTVFMHRFFSATANTLFDRNYDFQLGEENSSCATYAVVDSFAFLFTRHCALTLPKWKLHRIFIYNTLSLSGASSNVSSLKVRAHGKSSVILSRS